jgi:starch-binding outer membrane protein, SusD/RagB family
MKNPIQGSAPSAGRSPLAGGSWRSWPAGPDRLRFRRLAGGHGPQQLPAENLETPEAAPLLVNGAIGNFECALGATILVTGVIADEFGDAQLGAAQWPYDRRDANTQPGGIYGTSGCTSAQGPGIYSPLSVARWSSDNAFKALESFTDAQVAKRDSLMAASALYAGFSLAHLGMAMCSAALDEGPEITNIQLFAEAENRFATALQLAASGRSDGLPARRQCRAGPGRLFQGNTSGAAAAAALVPAGFVLNATASDAETRRYNRVFHSNIQSRFYTIEEQSRNLRTEGVPDPRARVINSGLRAADGEIAWFQQKYTAFGSPLPVARYQEAQLILAEAQGGQTAVNIINALRAPHGLPAYTGPTDAASIRSLVIEERRRELFVEGFRMYDIHRFNLPLIPPPGTAYPIKGGATATPPASPAGRGAVQQPQHRGALNRSETLGPGSCPARALSGAGDPNSPGHHGIEVTPSSGCPNPPSPGHTVGPKGQHRQDEHQEEAPGHGAVPPGDEPDDAEGREARAHGQEGESRDGPKDPGHLPPLSSNTPAIRSFTAWIRPAPVSMRVPKRTTWKRSWNVRDPIISRTKFTGTGLSRISGYCPAMARKRRMAGKMAMGPAMIPAMMPLFRESWCRATKRMAGMMPRL